MTTFMKIRSDIFDLNPYLINQKRIPNPNNFKFLRDNLGINTSGRHQEVECIINPSATFFRVSIEEGNNESWLR